MASKPSVAADSAHGMRPGVRLDAAACFRPPPEDAGQPGVTDGLVAGVAHDVNNLLSVIAGMGELALAGAVEGREALQAIARAASRAGDLVGHLLSIYRREPPAARVFDLGELTRQASKLLPSLLGPGIALEVSVEEGPLWVKAAHASVEQVLFNLATNARDAMPLGGHVWLDVRSLPLGDGPVGGPWVQLGCRDDGHGMDEATRARAFERFFTTKPRGKGTGLGLAQVYDAVGAAGGHVALHSEPGRGTAFDILLPRHGPPDQRWVGIDALTT